IDIATRIEPDGTCIRRVDYRYTRPAPGQAEGEAAEPPPVPDPLATFHRFPSGPSWTVRDEPGSDVHAILVEGRLASAGNGDGGYSRQNGPKVLPARNHVSYVGDPEHGLYEYDEILIDPSSPPASLRFLAERLVLQEGHFAALLEHDLGSPKHSRRSELRRA